MRTSFIAAALTAVCVGIFAAPSAAMAQAQVSKPDQSAVGTRVPIAAISCTRVGPPPQPVKPSADVLDGLDGAYRLSNGQKLQVDSYYNSVVADFGHRHQIPLVAIGPDRFESRDGLVRLRYEVDDRNERIVVSYPADRLGRYVDVC